MNSGVLDNFLNVLYEQAQVEIKNTNYQEAFSLLSRLLTLCNNNSKTQRYFGRVKSLLAETHKYLGKYYPAIKNAREALDFFKNLHDVKEIFKIHNLLGEIYFQNCEYIKAIKEWEEGLSIVKGLKKDKEINRMKVEVYAKLGETFKLLSEYSKARSIYIKGLVFCKNINDQVLLGRFLTGVGNTYHLENQFEKAIKIYYRALKQVKKNNDKFAMGRILHSIGDIFSKTGQLTKAKIVYEKSLEITEKTMDFATSVSSLRELGRLYLSTDLEKTPIFLEKSFDKLIENITAETRGLCERLMGKNFYLMAIYYYKVKDMDNATKSLIEAREIFSKCLMKKEQRRAQLLYEKIIRITGQKDKSKDKKNVLSFKLGIS